MHKFRFFMLILALCLLLSSCTTVEDLPSDMVITPPDTEISTLDTISDEQSGAYRKIVAAEYIGGGRNGVFWNHLMFTSLAEVINLESGEVLSACSDPLCNHSGDGCAKRVLMGANDMLVSSSSDQNDLVLYISNDQVTIDAEQSVTQNHRVLRYQFYTGEVTVLAENLPWEPLYFGIDPVTDNLFFQQRLISDTGETEVFLYILNGKSGKLDILPTPNMYPSAEYVVGDVVYFYDANSGGYFCFDLSQEELVMQEADSPDNYEEYVYYRENVMDVRVYVPDDLLPLYEEYGKEPYKVYTKYDMYRVKSGDESATPELVAKDILTGWAVGDYFLYYEFDPQYIASYFMDYAEDEKGVRQYTKYALDDPNVPQSALLLHAFGEYYVPIHILDADTLAEVAVIESDEYWIEPIFDLNITGEGAFVTWEKRTSEKHLLEQRGADTSNRTFGYLYFNKTRLTFEDTIVFDLPNTRK